MLAYKLNRARLRPFNPILLDETDLGAHRQAIKCAVKDAVAMEIDLPPVGSFDKAIVLAGDEF